MNRKYDLAKVGEVGVWGEVNPVAHVYLFDKAGRPLVAWDNAKDIKLGDKLYVAPKQWVGLTDEDIDDCEIEVGMPQYEISSADLYAFARVIEAKLKDKNHG
jgi:hypothetical protein